METDDKLRRELAALLARRKPQAEWTSMQDRLEQKAIERRIRLLEAEVLKSELATEE